MAGPITIYNSGDIYGGGGEAMHLGDGNDTVYMNGLPTITRRDEWRQWQQLADI